MRERVLARICVYADFLLKLLLFRLVQLYLHCRCDASTLLCFYVVGFKMCPIVAVKVRLNSAQFISPYLSLSLFLDLTSPSLAHISYANN